MVEASDSEGAPMPKSRTRTRGLLRVLPGAALVAFAAWAIGRILHSVLPASRGWQNVLISVLITAMCGGLVWAFLRLYALVESARREVQVMRTALDQSAQALRETEEKFSKTFRANPLGMGLSTLPEGRYVDVNEAFLRLAGFERQEVVGHTAVELGLWRKPHERNAMLSLIEKQGSVRDLEVTLSSKGGGAREVMLSADPLDWSGQKYLVVAIEDVTARRQVELNLRVTKEAAEAASRAKSEFLANVSHEIRTPINGILGMIELALDTELTGDQRGYLNAVKVSADSLLTVISDILDFSKIEARRLDLELLEFNLRDCLGDMLKPLALRAHQKQLELACHVPLEVPEKVVGDPGRLRQVILNLVGNAIKFTERGEVLVKVAKLTRSAEHAEVQFSVADTGIGIPADKQQLIFEAFAQADGTTTRRYGGTGLGLAICRQLAGMMGGRIWVESEAGKGSTFHFKVKMRLPQEASQPSAAPPVNLLGLPVLVVDDNATNRRIIEEILLGWGMNPVTAASGPEALAALDSSTKAGRPFALILLDGYMPEMDGFTLACRIKEHPQLAGPTIMMLTSCGQRGDAARCRELGVAAYLTKPIQQSELLEAIRGALRANANQTEGSILVTRHSLREGRRRLRVLVVEDNPGNQEMTRRLLEKRGHFVVAANDGTEALSILEQSGYGGYDLILMSMDMPRLNGFQVAAILREREKSTQTHIRLVAMTALAMKHERKRFLEAGMDGYVSKPVRADELFRTIEERPAADDQSPTSEEIPAEVLDPAVALARVDGDAGLLMEMAALFLDDYPKQLSMARKAIENGEAKAVERAAHALKGAVGSFAAQRAFEAAFRLEVIGRSGDLRLAAEALDHLETALEDLLGGLNHLRNQLSLETPVKQFKNVTFG